MPLRVGRRSQKCWICCWWRWIWIRCCYCVAGVSWKLILCFAKRHSRSFYFVQVLNRKSRSLAMHLIISGWSHPFRCLSS
ncbi:hypothetical protein NC652_032322 [Populus alba x Populus x berolinensis]|nr:hypothetical protein NC652_032322 [Populus alba x Populus x berolinensis]